MAFKNEYIREADYEKYDLLRVCRAHNQTVHRDRFVHPDSWTIDREREVFLVKIWVHREAEFSGYAFYWQDEWMFFDMHPVESKQDREANACWFRFEVKGFCVPDRLEARIEVLMAVLREAITAVPGGVTHQYSHRSATIDFITEQ